VAAGDFISLEGVVHLHTDLGVFLDLEDRRVFIAAQCMVPVYRPLRSDESVILQVTRTYAEQEGLVSS
jgi:hypothetical protein